jgi:hypothetical protein
MLTASHATAARTRQCSAIRNVSSKTRPASSATIPHRRTIRRRRGSGWSSVEYVGDDTRHFGCRLLLVQQVTD